MTNFLLFVLLFQRKVKVFKICIFALSSSKSHTDEKLDQTVLTLIEYKAPTEKNPGSCEEIFPSRHEKKSLMN